MEAQTFVFFGIMGSGKGTQVRFLMDHIKNKYGIESVYAGTGEGFRELVNSGNYIGNLIKDTMNRGELISDFLANAIFTNILTSSLTPEKNLFADGYPRNVSQSKIFEDMMRFFKRDPIKIIYIEVSKEEAMKRNLSRGRHDDTEEVISKRFNDYIENMVPAMEYFRGKKGYEIITINGGQSKEDVFKDIIKALEY